jgi:hypothetical protein
MQMADEPKTNLVTDDDSWSRINARPRWLPALIKFSLDILAIPVVLKTALQLENHMIESNWQLQILDTVTWLAASIPFINICHSGWVVFGELGQWASPSDSFHMNQNNPGPWGPIDAILDFGLAGKWIYLPINFV